VTTLVDGLEYQRQLSLIERNFKNILKSHMLKLLESRGIYWRSREKIKWEN
jgi:hypothetical protein